MADTKTIHPHLSGGFAPVRSEDDFEMEVVGRIPDELAGAYYRNGPNPQFDPQGTYVGFAGDGMIHGFFFATAGFARRGGKRRIRQDDSCSATWASRTILPPTMPAS